MKRRPDGFTLIELLIVIVVIGVIAAIAIPSLLRARVSANEAGCIGDIRTVLSGQTAYRSANAGHFDLLPCLAQPGVGCIPGYPAGAPSFLDPKLAVPATKSGYSRFFTPGPAPVPLSPLASPSSIDGFVYGGTPQTLNRTGVRGFGGQEEGVICYTMNGTDPAGGTPVLVPGCPSI